MGEGTEMTDQITFDDFLKVDIRAGTILEAEAFPEASMDQIEALRGDASTIANRFVRLIAEHIFDVVSPRGLPPPEEGERLAEIVRRVRPMARTVVDAELARALEHGIRAELGDRIESMFAKPDGE